MCGPQRDFEKFMPDDDFEKCTHGVSLNKDCLACDEEYGDNPICGHDAVPTGEVTGSDDLDFSLGLPITKCTKCGKEFVTVHKGRKHDAADN